MTEGPRQAQISHLHETFIRETGMRITLDYGKRQSWAMWLDYRTDQPFTEADLIYVIRKLQSQILKREAIKNELNFYGFIAPDRFEIRLEQFRKFERGRRPPTNREAILKATHRQEETIPEPKTTQIMLSGDVKARLEELRKAAE